MSERRDHFVYTAYDADGLMLYVGCTGRPAMRYRSHMTGDGGGARGWFNPFVDHWHVSGPYTKAKALDLEKARIQRFQPIWNGASEANAKGRRELIADYLAYHGVRFVPHPYHANRAKLEPVRRRRSRRHLKSVAS